MNHPSRIPPPHRPVIDGEWRILFTPQQHGCYVNDHCLTRGPDGRWHLFGITAPQAKPDPEHERYFVHAVGGQRLSEPMNEAGKACDDGTRAWSPGIARIGPHYCMFYSPSPTKMVSSVDLTHWIGHEVHLHGAPMDIAHRDHMVFQVAEDQWLLYIVGVQDWHGQVAVFTSSDLRDWRYVQLCLRTGGAAPLQPPWGACESPFVVKYGGWYYMLMTYTDCNPANYQDTLVFRSLNPYDFGSYAGQEAGKLAEAAGETPPTAGQAIVARLQTHGPELIHDELDDRWYITNCGWLGRGVPNEGSVSIAPVQWEQDA